MKYVNIGIGFISFCEAQGVGFAPLYAYKGCPAFKQELLPS